MTSCHVSDGSPNDNGQRCLVGTAVGEYCCKGKEDVGNDPEECEGDDDPGDGVTDCPEMTRKGTAQQQQGELKYQRKAFDD